MITTGIEGLNEIGDYVTVIGMPYAPRKIVDIDITMFPPVYTIQMADIDVASGIESYGEYSHEDVEYVSFDAVEHWQKLVEREQLCRECHDYAEYACKGCKRPLCIQCNNDLNETDEVTGVPIRDGVCWGCRRELVEREQVRG